MLFDRDLFSLVYIRTFVTTREFPGNGIPAPTTRPDLTFRTTSISLGCICLHYGPLFSRERRKPGTGGIWDGMDGPATGLSRSGTIRACMRAKQRRPAYLVVNPRTNVETNKALMGSDGDSGGGGHRWNRSAGRPAKLNEILKHHVRASIGGLLPCKLLLCVLSRRGSRTYALLLPDQVCVGAAMPSKNMALLQAVGRLILVSIHGAMRMW